MPKGASKTRPEKARCGLCGKTGRLIKTDCCGNWICDDEHKYVLFSFARNSCHRNHSRYTLCAFHHNEGHEGDWKNCERCRTSCETEMYVWYGTNEYNFEKLPNPPPFEPTKCSKCGVVIKLGTEGFTRSGDESWCEDCGAKEMDKTLRRTKGRTVPVPRAVRGTVRLASRSSERNMRSNPTDRMKDPFYAGLLFQIENIICQADDEAKTKGLQLTDSQVKSALIKTQKKLQGGEPDIPETNERERILAELVNCLIHAPDALMEQTTTGDGRAEEKPLNISDWVKALETVEDSVKTRKSHIPGSRDYLDFVHEFIGQAKGMK